MKGLLVLAFGATFFTLFVIPIAYGNHPLSFPQTATGPEYIYILAKDRYLVLDPVTLRILDTVNTGTWLRGLVPAIEGDFVYVTNPEINAVLVISTNTHQVVDTIRVEGAPGSIAISPDGKQLWVRTVNGVSVIDVAKREVIASIPTGGGFIFAMGPGATARFTFVPAIAEQPALVYVNNAQDNTITAIDMNSLTVVATIPVGTKPTGLDYSPLSKKLYVVNQESSDISVIDVSTNQVIKTIAAQKGAGGMEFSLDGRYAFVDTRHSRGGGDSLLVVDATTDSIKSVMDLRQTGIPTDQPVNPSRLFFSPDGKLGFAILKTSPHVFVFDVATQKLVKDIALTPLKPEAQYRCSVLVSHDGKSVYVTSAVEETITVIDIASLQVRNIIMTNAPTCSTYSVLTPGLPAVIAGAEVVKPSIELLPAVYALIASTGVLAFFTAYFAKKSRRKIESK